MRASESNDYVLPSALANRLQELMEQSRRIRDEFARISVEIDEVRRRIASLRREIPERTE